MTEVPKGVESKDRLLARVSVGSRYKEDVESSRTTLACGLPVGPLMEDRIESVVQFDADEPRLREKLVATARAYVGTIYDLASTELRQSIHGRYAFIVKPGQSVLYTHRDSETGQHTSLKVDLQSWGYKIIKKGEGGSVRKIEGNLLIAEDVTNPVFTESIMLWCADILEGYIAAEKG